MQYVVSLLVEVPDTLQSPNNWNWDELLNPEGTKPHQRTPAKLLGAQAYPIKGRKH